jgi:membrane associated rhomboid family serine protease
MFPIKDENPTKTIPFFTILIILANSFVFYREITSIDMEKMVFNYGLIPKEFIQNINHLKIVDSTFALFSSMFLHGGFFHIISNMWFFWIFGNNVEDALGHFRFLIFYLLCGIGAGLSQIIMNPNSQIPMVGASGAISGVLGAYFLLFPGARILTLVILFYFIRTVYIPAGMFILFWFLMQVISSFTVNPETGGIAWYAHIGGFLTGVFLCGLFVRKKVRRRLFS